MPNRRKEGLHPVQIYFTEEKLAQIRKAAASVQEPVSGWIRRAVFAALRKWEVPEIRTTFEKCNICGKHHDREDHFKTNE